MAEYLSPGVYVEEFDSGVKAMEGVGTSTAGFIGMAEKGPVRGMPVLITGMADYRRRFGGYLSEKVYGSNRFLPYAVEQFFANGGSACYVMRVCKEQENGSDGGAATAEGRLGETNTFLTMKAANPGAWGNRMEALFKRTLKNRTKITAVTDNQMVAVENTANYEIGDLVCIKDDNGAEAYNRVTGIAGNTVTLEWQSRVQTATDKTMLQLVEWNVQIADAVSAEQYENVSFNAEKGNCITAAAAKSQLVSIAADFSKLTEGLLEQISIKGEDTFLRVAFSGGNDGACAFSPDLYLGRDGASDERTGLKAFEAVQDVNIMSIPGITDKAVQSALVSHCENLKNRFAVLDMPLAYREVTELQEFRENIDSTYAAMYHPWLCCYDSLEKKNAYLPPSGAIAGIYARTDTSRGVHKAPANEVIRNCTGISVNYNEAEQGKLNPKGINLIRSLPGMGIRVWGARTCSGDGNWKYINVRRLFIFLEESIKANTSWAVFEPNDEMLWSRVEGTIRVFLTSQWRNGALSGNSADEAFFINIGKSTMTQDDILNGRLICVIGVAPVRPAEFVIFRITQKMETAQ